MAKETTYAGKLGDWYHLLGPLATNTGDLPHLEAPRAKLAALLAQGLEIKRAQAAHRAAKQELSKQLKAIASDGDRLATLLRQALKEHYGIRSEKLAEFGLQPFRGRPRKQKTTPETPATPEGPGHSPSPTPASPPGSDTKSPVDPAQ